MKSLTVSAALCLLLAQLAGCGGSAGGGYSASAPVTPVASQPQSPNAAIEAAIRTHLSARGNLNLAAFDTKLEQVDVQGDHAQAKAAFQLKNGPVESTLELTYQLEKRNGTWEVVSSDAGGGPSGHGSPGQQSVGQTRAAPTIGGNSLDDTLRSFKGGPSDPSS